MSQLTKLDDLIIKELEEVKDLKQDIGEYEVEDSQYEARIDILTSLFDTFMDFFKNMVISMENTKDMFLIDQLVKSMFLNVNT
ncbi:hypothetical protein KBH77_04955 [Patescibacteria group bacterium]|nr:hypothetical protein [Patescibacteria group bacterium]